MTSPKATSFPATDLQGAADQWQRDGWAIIEQLIPAELTGTALEELRDSNRSAVGGPVLRPEVKDRRPGDQQGDDVPAFRSRQFDGTTLFPVENCPTLNRLFVHPGLIEFAALALGQTDLRMYQSRVWSKRGGHTNYEQPMHRDGNHSLVPLPDVPSSWHLECFVYLQDVDHTNGATGIVPGAAARAGLTDKSPLTREEAPKLYEEERLASAPAGSVVAYRSDVWHRGHNLLPGSQRDMLVVAFRPAEATWVGFDEHAPLVGRPDWVTFAERCTPDELALFEVPRPGHPHWTDETLGAMAHLYPGLDLEPWRAALS